MRKYKVSQYAKLNNVTSRTVWNWIYAGKVNIERTASNRVLILEEVPLKPTYIAIYCRVSSSENKDNLDKQKQRLIDYCCAKGYTITKVVTEIGSGLNDKRPKLETLLLDRSITIIVVEHKDRLARFGTNYLEKLLELDNRKVEVVNQAETNTDDLMQDFVSIITSFTARLYGLRRSKRNTEKLIKELTHVDS